MANLSANSEQEERARAEAHCRREDGESFCSQARNRRGGCGQVAGIPLTSDPILQWEKKVEESQKVFEDASKTLKTEVTRFEVGPWSLGR